MDLKRQLQVVEQEAVVLQSKLQSVEGENDKLVTENNRLLLISNRGIKKPNTDLNNGETNGDKVATKQLEVSLATANNKIIELTELEKQQKEDIDKMRKQLIEVISLNSSIYITK